MQYITAKQAADMTGLSEKTIRRYVDSGRLKAKRVARNRLAIAVEDLPQRVPTPLEDQVAQLQIELGGLRTELRFAKSRISVLEAAVRGRGEIIGTERVMPSPEPLRTSQTPLSVSGQDLPSGWVPAMQFLLDHGIAESTARRRLRMLAHHTGLWSHGVKFAFDPEQLAAAKSALGIE